MQTLYKTSLQVLLLATVISTLSCKKFLMEDPKTSVVETNYYKTKDDAIAAVNSVYAYLNALSSGDFEGVYHSGFYVVAGLASDELLNQQFAADALDKIATFTYGPDNDAVLKMWSIHYKAITIANIAINRIPQIQMDATLRTRLVNEAKFLRGILYFDLVRLYRDVPLVLTEDAPLKPAQANPEDVYTQIIKDLTDAKELPVSYSAGNGLGRATGGAAAAFLAKVYLTRGEWEKSRLACMDIINSNHYQLYDDFKDLFKISSVNGKETIFSVQFGTANGAVIFWEDGQQNVRFLPTELTKEIPGVNAQGWQVPTLELYNSFETDDRRRSVTFLTSIHETNGNILTIRPYIQKYWDRTAEPNAGNTENEYKLMRYADVILMCAEANNELGRGEDAYKYINMIRKRARFNGTEYLNTLPDYKDLSQQQFRDAVLKERRMEFVAEGQRWFDLARTGTLEKLVPIAKPGVTPAPRNYLYPIPQREVDINTSLKQNPLY
jgi:hypothetical protein